MSEKVIYNCHIHTLTADESPTKLLKNFLWPWLGVILSGLLSYQWFVRPVVKLLEGINRKSSNDVLERQARFLELGNKASQADIFMEIEQQYPDGTFFTAMAVDTTFANLGAPKISIEKQHETLLALARENPNVIPFYAVDPRHEDIVERVKKHVGGDGFKGIKIYPNLGYRPDHPVLMKVYEHCQEVGVPVTGHCSSSGLWQYGLKEPERRAFSHPHNYIPVLKTFKDLRVNLAHFGGDGEWEKHMKSRSDELPEEKIPWCRVIAEMIRSGEYPNLYTDISYTLFMPRPQGEQVEYCDYLKVMLVDEDVRNRVLFGSDFYMSRREKITEKELSIMLRSRLGEDLFFQIANQNPRRFLFGEE